MIWTSDAPNTAPETEPIPPTIIIIKPSPDTVQWVNSGDIKPFNCTYREPASEAIPADIPNAIVLYAFVYPPIADTLLVFCLIASKFLPKGASVILEII